MRLLGSVFSVLLIAIGTTAAHATTFTVNVNASSFSPSNRTIEVGDAIEWVWTGGSHTTTHVPAQGQPVLWNAPINSTNQDFTRTFNTAGTFNYKCTPHGFTGNIIVNPISGILDDPGTGNADAAPTALRQNSPNPFNAATQIEYSLATDGYASLTIFNILGQTVATLADGFQTSGVHTVLWDGRDHSNHEVSSGIYFARMVADGGVMTRKMVLLR